MRGALGITLLSISLLLSLALTYSGGSAGNDHVKTGMLDLGLDDHACALLEDGRIMCWGLNEFGQVGDGTHISRTAPVYVIGIEDAVQVASGGSFSCALLRNGSVACWGCYWCYCDPMDVHISHWPVKAKILVPSDAVQISASFSHVCALLRNGSVECWGCNFHGEAGVGEVSEMPWDYRYHPVQLNAVQVSSGGFHTCALLANGSVACWGLNDSGQLGMGSVSDPVPSPVRVPYLKDVSQVSAGYRHTCALLANGSVACWGDNRYGQLGDGTKENRSIPVKVLGLKGAVRVEAGARHTCALLRDMSVVCWGDNEYGQLGDGTLVSKPKPVRVKGISDAIEVSSGWSVSCALLENGTITCWGAVGNQNVYATPVSAEGLSNVAEVSAGYRHTCAILRNGTLTCWGDNGVGQLGIGAKGGIETTPVCVPGLENVSHVSAGKSHSCAITTNGSVVCWGYRGYGRVGDGNNDGVAIAPSRVIGLKDAVQVAAGGFHTCALLSNGSVACWGWNSDFQLGGDIPTFETSIPILTGVENATQVVTGMYHTCALLSNGSVACWGWSGYGQLGHEVKGAGVIPKGAKPGLVIGIDNASQIATGCFHTCALLSNGSVACWGDNGYGQLGDGTSEDRSYPVLVADLTDAVQIATGCFHTCALPSNGSVACWGDSSYGQLGSRILGNSSIPVRVYGIDNAARVSAGGFHTCAVLRDGRLKCWGDDSHGQLGDGTNETGTYTRSSIPKPVVGYNYHPTKVAAPEVKISSIATKGLSIEVKGEAIPGYDNMTITRILWDWGDGTREESQFPGYHNYSRGGAYVITITAYQSDGLKTKEEVFIDLRVKGPITALPWEAIATVVIIAALLLWYCRTRVRRSST